MLYKYTNKHYKKFKTNHIYIYEDDKGEYTIFRFVSIRFKSSGYVDCYYYVVIKSSIPTYHKTRGKVDKFYPTSAMEKYSREVEQKEAIIYAL
jgi:hypothetical protein